MILTPQGTDIFFEKTDFKIDERKVLKETYGKDRIYFCACNKKVPYKLSTDNRFYPCNLDIKHEKTCPESDYYKTSQKRNSAYIEKTDDSGSSVLVKVRDINRYNSDKGEEYLLEDRKCKQDVKELSLESYLEILFLSAYATMKRSTKQNRKDIYKIAYAKICSTDVIYNGRQCPLKGDETPFKIFYGKLSKITMTKKETRDGYTKIYTISLNGREIDVSEENLNLAIENFKKKYNSSLKVDLLCVVRRMKSKYKIEKAYFSDTEIIFYPISKLGCICSNTFEQAAINEIENMEENQNYWYFYKPYEYGWGAFGDKYLEDGVISIRNSYRRICLDFVGNEDEQYKQKHKEKIKTFINNGRYTLLTLTPQNYKTNIVFETIKR